VDVEEVVEVVVVGEVEVVGEVVEVVEEVEDGMVVIGMEEDCILTGIILIGMILKLFM
jgi:hypothetical protein